MKNSMIPHALQGAKTSQVLCPPKPSEFEIAATTQRYKADRKADNESAQSEQRSGHETQETHLFFSSRFSRFATNIQLNLNETSRKSTGRCNVCLTTVYCNAK